MIPISDERHPRGGLPLVNLAIIALNLAAFILLQLPSEAFTMGYSAIPAEILGGQDLVGPVRVRLPDGSVETILEAPGPDPIYLTLITSIFMHGGWVHLLGNMLFLYVFGDNIEAAFGSLPYFAFYMVVGVLASLAHVFANAASVIPSLGASGAISGVLAAYLLLFPRNRVRVLVFFRFIPFTFTVSAMFMIGLWALFQFVNGFAAIAPSEETSGVAYMAHIGGFLAGLAITFLARPYLDRGQGLRAVG